MHKMKIPQVFTLIHENPSGFYVDPLFRSESLPYAHTFLHLSNYISCKICANARKNKKDTQEWKPLKCLISKLLRFVAGPGIEPGTS